VLVDPGAQGHQSDSLSKQMRRSYTCRKHKSTANILYVKVETKQNTSLVLSNYIHVLFFEMRIMYSRSNGSDVCPMHWSYGFHGRGTAPTATQKGRVRSHV
jgi:hypothetical protein